MDSHVYDTSYVIVSEEAVGAHFVASVQNALARKEGLTVTELLNEPFLLTERGMSYRRLMDEKLAERSLEVRPVLETARADVICSLVEEDMGLSFLPDYVTEEGVRSGRLKRLEVADFQVVVWKQLLYRREKWLSPPMQALIRHLSDIWLQKR